MHTNWASMYAYIKSKLSQESEDEVKRHGDYSTFSKDVCPKGLWLVIKEKHLVTRTSQDAHVVRQKASEDYSKLRQGAFESLYDFKRRFDLKYKAFVAHGNHLKDNEDVAMDFLKMLDTSRYSGFVMKYLNGI